MEEAEKPVGQCVAPYARGQILATTSDDYRKVQWARSVIRSRAEAGLATYNLTGLCRRFAVEPAAAALIDDDLGPAFYERELLRLALDHLGGSQDCQDVAVANRLSAALMAFTLSVIGSEDTVVGVSARHSHPAVWRPVELIGARFIDVLSVDGLREVLERGVRPKLITVTRLSVSYELLSTRDIFDIIDLAHQVDAVVLMDDAGGARVGPAIKGQPKTLEFGADAGATGLDKYGLSGPRLGLLGGDSCLIEQARSRMFELALEARPMLYPAVVESLKNYRPERVAELVDATRAVAAELRRALGTLINETEVTAQIGAGDLYRHVVVKLGVEELPVAPYEVTACLAMLLLRDYGFLTVHFAGLPPGTSSLLIKFVPPEVLEAIGGPARLSQAVKNSVNRLTSLVTDTTAVRELLFGEPSSRREAEHAVVPR